MLCAWTGIDGPMGGGSLQSDADGQKGQIEKQRRRMRKQLTDEGTHMSRLSVTNDCVDGKQNESQEREEPLDDSTYAVRTPYQSSSKLTECWTASEFLNKQSLDVYKRQEY